MIDFSLSSHFLSATAHITIIQPADLSCQNLPTCADAGLVFMPAGQ